MKLAPILTKGERTRAHIVSVASGLFWRRNFHGVSVDQIADAAEVNKATVYRYFADKRDLALAVVRYHGKLVLNEVFAGSLARFARPDERIASIYRDIYCAHRRVKDETGDVYGCPIVGLALELGQEMPALRQEARGIFEKVEEHLRHIAADAVIERGLDAAPETLARTLAQLLHGAFASARVSADPERILDAGSASLALLGYPDTTLRQTEPSCDEPAYL